MSNSKTPAAPDLSENDSESDRFDPDKLIDRAMRAAHSIPLHCCTAAPLLYATHSDGNGDAAHTEGTAHESRAPAIAIGVQIGSDRCTAHSTPLHCLRYRLLCSMPSAVAVPT